MNIKNSKGITLVALVVTIVVLLILAGVSINLVLGENGLITQAQEAKRKTAEAKENEITSMDSASDWVSETVNNTSLPQNTTTKPYMPSSEFKKVEGTNLANGLVIEDASGNQYVWVEVPMTEEVYPTAGLEITAFSTEEYTKIENDLHNYTKDYRDDEMSVDQYYEDSSEGWFKDTEEYNAQKYKILKSIYTNGGFWVGRYEAGIEENRSEIGEATVKPQSKINLYPYTFVTRTQAKKLAEMVEYGRGENKYVGNLMFGVQWDLVLKFIEVNNRNDEEIVSKLNKNSTELGNYSNATFKINRGKYAVCMNDERKLSETWLPYTTPTDNCVDKNSNKLEQTYNRGVLLTTGAADRNCQMNIYDIAGNVWEWTLEEHIENPTLYPGTRRSGCYLGVGNGEQAAYHNNGHRTGDSYNFIGFRVSIY